MRNLFARWRLYFRRRFFRLRLNARERYLFELMCTIPSKSSWVDGVRTFTINPNMDDFFRLLDELAAQCEDNMAMMSNLVGYELALQLPVHKILRMRAVGPPEAGMPAVQNVVFLRTDIRKLHDGAFFRLHSDQKAIYTVLSNEGDKIIYQLAKLGESPVRVYPKEEGEVLVYLVNPELIHKQPDV